jgi:hypothetical protein
MLIRTPFRWTYLILPSIAVTIVNCKHQNYFRTVLFWWYPRRWEKTGWLELKKIFICMRVTDKDLSCNFPINLSEMICFNWGVNPSTVNQKLKGNLFGKFEGTSAVTIFFGLIWNQKLKLIWVILARVKKLVQKNQFKISMIS